MIRSRTRFIRDQTQRLDDKLRYRTLYFSVSNQQKNWNKLRIEHNRSYRSWPQRKIERIQNNTKLVFWIISHNLVCMHTKGMTSYMSDHGQLINLCVACVVCVVCVVCLASLPSIFLAEHAAVHSSEPAATGIRIGIRIRIRIRIGIRMESCRTRVLFGTGATFTRLVWMRGVLLTRNTVFTPTLEGAVETNNWLLPGGIGVVC